MKPNKEALVLPDSYSRSNVRCQTFPFCVLSLFRLHVVRFAPHKLGATSLRTAAAEQKKGSEILKRARSDFVSRPAFRGSSVVEFDGIFSSIGRRRSV